jgi:hypothetical protein
MVLHLCWHHCNDSHTQQCQVVLTLTLSWSVFSSTADTHTHQNFSAYQKQGHTRINVPLHKSSPTTHLWSRMGERMYSSYSFTTSALDGDEWSASCPATLYPRGKDPGTHCTGGWVGCPRASLDTRGYRKNPFAPAGDQTSIAQSSSL